jgi:hypothetical protein
MSAAPESFALQPLPRNQLTHRGATASDRLPTAEEVSQYTPAELLAFLKREQDGLPHEVWDALDAASMNGAAFLDAAGDDSYFRERGLPQGSSRLCAYLALAIRGRARGGNGD